MNLVIMLQTLTSIFHLPSLEATCSSSYSLLCHIRLIPSKGVSDFDMHGLIPPQSDSVATKPMDGAIIHVLL
jgi:hypothetical protein